MNLGKKPIMGQKGISMLLACIGSGGPNEEPGKIGKAPMALAKRVKGGEHV
jgi:hypothetical protein